MVQEALKAQRLLEAEGISARVIDMHTIKPIDRDIILKAAEETGAIVTAEEHNVICLLYTSGVECAKDMMSKLDEGSKIAVMDQPSGTACVQREQGLSLIHI